jgi:hypothetical protein
VLLIFSEADSRAATDRPLSFSFVYFNLITFLRHALFDIFFVLLQ